MSFLVGLFVLSLVSCAKSSSYLWIVRVSVENDNAVVDHPNPRLGWLLVPLGNHQNVSQNAYQILVASNQVLLNSEKPDLWDTGKVYSNESWNIRYEGKTIKPGQTVFWAVRVWDQDNVVTEYTQDSWRQEFDINQWSAKWIGAPENFQQVAFKNLQTEDKQVIKSHPGLKPVSYFRKTFSIVEPVERGVIYCTAKGIFMG